MAGKIFINYRRDDLIGMAGRLHDRLAQAFGPDNIFMDVDNIPVGEDFVAYLTSQVAKCDVLLAVIGPKWLRAKDKKGQRRLHQPDDWVAIELAAAFKRDVRVRVIPILVEGTRMPRESELPDSLKLLARRQAAEVRHAHFGKDAEALVTRMRKAMAADSEKARLEAEAQRKAQGEQKQPEATTLKNPENPAPRPVELVVVPPFSPPRDWRLRELILGYWYDRAENEYFIGNHPANDGRLAGLLVRQTIKQPSKPDKIWDGAGSVKGEIVSFNCFLPKMGGFEGKLVRSANVYTLVGQYATVDGRWDVTLHRSPAPPPQSPQREAKPGPSKQASLFVPSVDPTADFIKRWSLSDLMSRNIVGFSLRGGVTPDDVKRVRKVCRQGRRGRHEQSRHALRLRSRRGAGLGKGA